MMDEDNIKTIASRLKQGENRKFDCPECLAAGKHKGDLSLSVMNKGDHAVYNCHREPSHSGRVELYKTHTEKSESPVTKSPPTPEQATSGQVWLETERKVPYDRVSKFIEFGSAYFKAAQRSLPCIEFVFRNDAGRKVYSKFRAIEQKLFTSGVSSPGGTDTFYLNEAIDYEKNYLIITEGEIDALTLKAAGFNAVSMPTGANIKWLGYNKEKLARFKHVLVWFDTDAKGDTVAEKLKAAPPALTRNVTYIVANKMEAIAPGCKDANDVLKTLGTAELKRILAECFERHRPDYIIKPSSLIPSLIRVRDNTYSNRIGIDEPRLDEVMSLPPGYAGITTGIPGHGKSTFLSWYAYRRADKYGSRTVFWSPENDPALLSADLMGMAAGRILQGHAGVVPMSDADIERGARFLDQHFRIVQDGEEGSDIDEILNQMLNSALDMGGADLYVIDPFNYIKLPEVKDKLVAEKIVYRKIRTFARVNNCFVMLVAHPRKMEETERPKQKEGDDASESPERNAPSKKYKVPGMYSVSGSADFANMADVGITVYRDDRCTTIHNWKARRPFLGTMGASADVVYQPASGRFRVLGTLGAGTGYDYAEDAAPF